MSAASLRKLQRVQNTAARILTGSRKYDHITPVLRQLHWLLVEYHVQYKILLVTYKALQGQAPGYIKDLLQFRTTGCTLRSSARDDLHVPQTKLRTYGDRAFTVAAPNPWNSLPFSLRQSPSTVLFKKQLKAHLLRLAYLI